MAGSKEAIKIEGLNEFVRNLKKIDSDLPKMVRVAFNESADIVVDDVRPRIPSKSGRARGSVKARSTQRFARVKGGGAKAPYYPWLDFGGQIGRKSGKARGNRGKRPWVGADGRYIYRSYFEARDSGRFEEVMTKSLIKVVESAGIQVD